MMKKAYAAPELDVLRLDIPDSITDDSTIYPDLSRGEDVGDW